MTFQVFGPMPRPDVYGDDATRHINEHGVLTVWTDERQITYGIYGWWRVDEPRLDRPGKWLVAPLTSREPDDQAVSGLARAHPDGG